MDHEDDPPSPRRRQSILGAVLAALLLLIAAGRLVRSAGSTPAEFSTLPSSAAGLPRDDASCGRRMTSDAWEPRPDNTAANHTVPPAPVAWSNDDGALHWTRWVANRSAVTGNYKGTTNQIIEWAACKWGLDEDLLRAVATQESDWHMSAVGDRCGAVGQASYGLFQIKNAYCNGAGAFGGYPDTASDTALNADFYGAYLRSCLDNDFYDGGSWLYNGHDRADRRRPWVRLRRVGMRRLLVLRQLVRLRRPHYITGVQRHLAHKDWPRDGG